MWEGELCVSVNYSNPKNCQSRVNWFPAVATEKNNKQYRSESICLLKPTWIENSFISSIPVKLSFFALLGEAMCFDNLYSLTPFTPESDTAKFIHTSLQRVVLEAWWCREYLLSWWSIVAGESQELPKLTSLLTVGWASKLTIDLLVHTGLGSWSIGVGIENQY